MTATVQWSSENYDYMIVGGEKYLPLSTEGGSVFEIPVFAFDEPMDVIDVYKRQQEKRQRQH